MTVSNATIRQTIYDALDLPGINRYKYPADSIQVPAVVVAGLDMNRVTFDGHRRSSATVMIVVSHSHVDQLVTLDRMLDPDDNLSVLAALEQVTDEGGVSLAWEEAGSYGEVTWNGTSYYGAAVTLQVWT